MGGRIARTKDIVITQISARNARLLRRVATKKMRFPCKDRIMKRTKDQTLANICPDHDLSMTSR